MVAKVEKKAKAGAVEEPVVAAAATKRKIDEVSVGELVDSDSNKAEHKRARKAQEKKVEREKKERTLFVKSFPGDFTEADLKKLSADIVSVKIEEKGSDSAAKKSFGDEGEETKKKKKKKRVRKSAYLEFRSKEKLDVNFETLKNTKFPNGQQLLVDYVGARSTYQKEAVKKKVKGQRDLKRLHVSGIDKTLEDAEVKKLFPKCEDFFMQKKRDTNLNLGFAFVQFNTEEEARKIREATNGKELKGKKLLVDYAVSRDQTRKAKFNKKKLKLKSQ